MPRSSRTEAPYLRSNALRFHYRGRWLLVAGIRSKNGKGKSLPQSLLSLLHTGCAVLLDINNGDKLMFAHLNKNASVKIGNTKCMLDALVGHPFGSVPEVQCGPEGASSFVRVPLTGAADLLDGIVGKDDGEDEMKSNDTPSMCTFC